jgi:hypothetical protein
MRPGYLARAVIHRHCVPYGCSELEMHPSEAECGPMESSPQEHTHTLASPDRNPNRANKPDSKLGRELC